MSEEGIQVYTLSVSFGLTIDLWALEGQSYGGDEDYDARFVSRWMSHNPPVQVPHPILWRKACRADSGKCAS